MARIFVLYQGLECLVGGLSDCYKIVEKIIFILCIFEMYVIFWPTRWCFQKLSAFYFFYFESYTYKKGSRYFCPLWKRVINITNNPVNQPAYITFSPILWSILGCFQHKTMEYFQFEEQSSVKQGYFGSRDLKHLGVGGWVSEQVYVDLENNNVNENEKLISIKFVEFKHFRSD